MARSVIMFLSFFEFIHMYVIEQFQYIVIGCVVVCWGVGGVVCMVGCLRGCVFVVVVVVLILCIQGKLILVGLIFKGNSTKFF